MPAEAGFLHCVGLAVKNPTLSKRSQDFENNTADRYGWNAEFLSQNPGDQNYAAVESGNATDFLLTPLRACPILRRLVRVVDHSMKPRIP
jgi:hypothetical protein